MAAFHPSELDDGKYQQNMYTDTPVTGADDEKKMSADTNVGFNEVWSKKFSVLFW